MKWMRKGLLDRVLAMGAVLAVGSAVCVLVWEGSVSSPAMAQVAGGEEPQPVQPVTYARIQSLRSELALESSDIAAMGLTGPQADALLKAMRSWVESNTASLDSLDASQRKAAADLQDAYRRFHVGPEDDSAARAIPRLESDLASAVAAKAQAISGLVSQVEARLDTGQRSAWRTARQNRAFAPPLRHAPDLSASQVQAIKASRDPGLSPGQAVAAVQAASNAQLRIREVLAAEEAVLPLPAEYREERAGAGRRSALGASEGSGTESGVSGE